MNAMGADAAQHAPGSIGRAFYADSISGFLGQNEDSILGILATGNLTHEQITPWRGTVDTLKRALPARPGGIFFEYAIPRMGRRIDTVLVTGGVIFVIEFKVGATAFLAADIDQVWDYALDLKNFHETSHDLYVAPVLVATDAERPAIDIALKADDDRLLRPVRSNAASLKDVLASVLNSVKADPIDPFDWEHGRYCPTPTIVEAALALYKGHSVAEISRSDAGAQNLHETTDAISRVITAAKTGPFKAICFVTGVPGAGKTLIGLNIATKHLRRSEDIYSVFLSGNGPLVKVLQEALARDRIARAATKGDKLRKGNALSEVKMFVQNVHHYRDAYLQDPTAPVDHVALFDEAQRAWNLVQTEKFTTERQ